MTTCPPVLGIIGGSGLYEIDGMTDISWHTIDSPFGKPSDDLLSGTLDGQKIAFLPRHGRGHAIPPGEVNYRANIDALKRFGVTEIISISAVGSLKEELPPGAFVIVDQFIDRTMSRPASFFGTGGTAHVSLAEPVCSRLGDLLERAAREGDIPVERGGTYLVMEGPQFSTKAESNLYRSWDCAVIGMTNMPEARLAREAELCYATLGMVTDYDCWHPDHDHVSVDSVVKVLRENVEKARVLVKKVSPLIRERMELCPCGCHRALEHAFITAREARDPALLEKLQCVAGRVF